MGRRPVAVRQHVHGKHGPASLPVRSPVRLANCRAVSLHANMVKNALPFLVKIGVNVDGLLHNDPSGIRAEAVHAAQIP